MVELDVPAMIHGSGSCNPAMHATGGYYIAADTIAFMQLLEGDLFADFPALRFIIPHGGGAVRGIDPTTGHYFDDTKRYVDALAISEEERHAIFEGNARRVFPRLDAQLKERGL
jgi:predicted TIM-barrel fold metal-dependent hydrolase